MHTQRHNRPASRNFDLAALDCRQKRAVIGFGLVGARGGESSQRSRHLCTGAAIAANPASVAGTGVAARKQLAGDEREALQATAAQKPEIDSALVVVELADEVLVGADGGPAEEEVGKRLDGALAFGHAAALMVAGSGGDEGGA